MPLPLPSPDGQALGSGSSEHVAHMGCKPLASLSAGQNLAAPLILDLISIFITSALKKIEEVSYICVYVCVSVVSRDPTCRVVLLQHPSEIAFLNAETRLPGAWKVSPET